MRVQRQSRLFTSAPGATRRKKFNRSSARLVRGFAPALGFLLPAFGALGQQVWVPPPAPPQEVAPAPFGLENTNRFEAANTNQAPAASPMTPARNPLQWGAFDFHPGLTYQFSYGDGIQSQPGQREKTAIHRITPDLNLNLGRVWRVDYAPTAAFYSNPRFRNTVDHSVRLDGMTQYEDWRLGLSQRCSLTSDPLTETAAQTDQQNYSTTLFVAYQFSSALSLETSWAQNFYYTGAASSSPTNLPPTQDSRDWSTLDWLNYEWSPNVATALGAGFGYTDVQTGNDMTYEQIQARITFQVTHKISLSLNGGGENRQFLASGGNAAPPSRFSPIFGASLAYRPFEVTTLSLSASRATSASFFQNQLTEATGVTATINQRLLGRLFLNLSGGFTHTAYPPTAVVVVSPKREDNYDYFSIGLSASFLRKGTASVSYSASKNSSNLDGLSYNSSQIGAQIGFNY